MSTAEARKVINTHDQLRASGGGVAICTSMGGVRRDYVQGWYIYKVNGLGQKLITDADAHWSDNNCKVFLLSRESGDSFHEKRRNALETAKRWVAEKGWYSGEWARNRMGDYIPKEINKRFPLPKSS